MRACDFEMHAKPTQQGMALSSLSRHLPSIHTSWVRSRIVHYSRCCSDVNAFRSACWQLFRKVRLADSRHCSLGHIVLCIIRGRVVGDSLPRIVRKREKCSRVIVPYHPSLSGLPRLLNSFKKAFVEAGIADFVPCISWSLAGRSIHAHVLEDYKRKLAC